MIYSQEDKEYLQRQKDKVKRKSFGEPAPISAIVVPNDWNLSMRIERRSTINEMVCIIDDTFNTQEYEAIIALYPGIRNKHKSKIATRFYDFYINSKSRGKTFCIQLNDYVDLIASPCVYCGDSGDSIDRIDSSKGYTVDNVQISCRMCNMMKYKYSSEVFINQVKKIANYQKAKNQ